MKKIELSEEDLKELSEGKCPAGAVAAAAKAIEPNYKRKYRELCGNDRVLLDLHKDIHSRAFLGEHTSLRARNTNSAICYFGPWAKDFIEA